MHRCFSSSDPRLGREDRLVFFRGVEDGRSGMIAARKDREGSLGRERGESG